jgi:small subunit ribosomal protein S17
MTRGKPKTKMGIVLSDKMDKTVVVNVAHIFHHPKFNKPIKRNSKYKAHDEKNECRVGDKVLITEARPLSKTKRWRVTKTSNAPNGGYRGFKFHGRRS